MDTVPTIETVTQDSEDLLAEVEQMGHQAKRKEGQLEVQPRSKSWRTVRRLKTLGKPKEEQAGGKEKAMQVLPDRFGM